MLRIAWWVGAVDVAGAFFTAVATDAGDRGIDAVDGHADALIEDITFAIVIFAANFFVFSIFDNATKELTDVLEPFLDEESAKFFTADTAGAVGNRVKRGRAAVMLSPCALAKRKSGAATSEKCGECVLRNTCG